MCYVTSTDLKKNLSHYLSLSKTEEVFITKNGKTIAVLSNPKDQAFREFFAFQKTLRDKEPETDYDSALFEEMLKR